MKQYAFINADSQVVQVISGVLNSAQQAQFLRDYGVLFGAVAVLEVDAATAIWIGGSYTDGEFQAPPAPEPAPEPLPEVLPEPILESEV